MKKAIIIPNPIKDESFAVTAEIVRRLIKLKIDSFIEEKYKNNSITKNDPLNANTKKINPSFVT